MTLGARPTTGSTSTPKRFSKCFSIAARNSVLVVIDTTTLPSFFASSIVLSHSPDAVTWELWAIAFNEHATEPTPNNRTNKPLGTIFMKRANASQLGVLKNRHLYWNLNFVNGSF